MWSSRGCWSNDAISILYEGPAPDRKQIEKLLVRECWSSGKYIYNFEALSEPGFVGNNYLICLNGKPQRASVLDVRLDGDFPPSSTPASSHARGRTGDALRLGPAVLRSYFAHRFGPLHPALRMVRQRCSTESAHLVGACVNRQARLSVSYHQCSSKFMNTW